MYEDFDDDDDPRPRGKLIAVVILLALVGWFGYQKVATGDGGARGGIQLDPSATSTSTIGVAATSEPVPERDSTSDSSSIAPVTSAPVTASTTIAMPATSVPTTTAPTTTAPTATAIAPSPTSVAPDPGLVLPNGVAVGAMVTFDGAAVTMSGALPNDRARDRLTMFVTAANVTGKPIVNGIAVDPAAPGGDSVRFVGLDPQAFPEGTNDIYPPHAAELDRLAELLNAFPDVTIVVVGRADQRGPEERNLGIAERRAEALVTYFVGCGVDPNRLSAVAFGELDPTNADDNVVALALNRRAEFVLYGLAA